VLRRRPNEGNWSEVPNIRDEVNALISECEWYRVYDISEGLYRYLSMHRRENEFSERLNRLFEEDGIGWQMVEGQIVTRGDVEFEHAVTGANTATWRRKSPNSKARTPGGSPGSQQAAGARRN